MLLINYNKTKSGSTRLYFEPIKWKEPDDFLRYLNMRDSTATDVQQVTDPSGIVLLIKNDKQPQYYTSFDDENIVMDSWDSAIDDTVHESKIQAYGYIIPSAEFDNSWIPDLPEEAFALLYNEALSKARFQLDTISDQKAEQESNRQNRWLARKGWRVNGGIKYPNYGRRGKKHHRDVTFKENN